MTAAQLLQALSEALYVIIFLLVAARTMRQPSRANIDMALFFGATAIIVIEARIFQLLGWEPNPISAVVNSILLMALPYLLLRLADDFLEVSPLVMQGAALGLGLIILAIVLFRPLPPLLVPVLLAYFVGLQFYTARAFTRGARRSSGVTRRRMEAVAAGSLFLGSAFIVLGFQIALPAVLQLWQAMYGVLAFLSGVAYYIGFAPPMWLRRAWQEPELRAFLSRAAHLPRLPDTISIVQELEQGAAASVGAPHASIGLWNEQLGKLEFHYQGEFIAPPDDRWVVTRTYESQKPLFSENARAGNPDHAAAYQDYQSRAVLAAPITAGDRKLGVLCVYAPSAPIFADSDMELVQLLADQAAVILESRALIDEAARVQAREEVTRLKDDFLSAAAHDLKTPLTTILAQAQLMERQIQRRPDQPVDPGGLQRIVREAKRLNRLVHELLDASRVEQGRLLGIREPVDLVQIALEVCEGWRSERHRCYIEADAPVEGELDRARMMQLLENLVENAVKYSPNGGDIRVRVWRENGEAQLTVTDQGIGIAASDLPMLFDRFQRGTNVDDRRFAGMGLGLFICRGIAEQHGGRIWADSAGEGHGSTFHVALPLRAEDK